jgi:hypothetical protein
MDWELTIVSSQKYKLPETFKSYCAIETETNLHGRCLSPHNKSPDVSI